MDPKALGSRDTAGQTALAWVGRTLFTLHVGAEKRTVWITHFPWGVQAATMDRDGSVVTRVGAGLSVYPGLPAGSVCGVSGGLSLLGARLWGPTGPGGLSRVSAVCSWQRSP